MYRTGNPALRNNVFSIANTTGTSMTIQGTVTKTMILLGCVVFSAMWLWTNNVTNFGIILPSVILGFIFAIATCIKPQWAPITAPIYALTEGIVIGMISILFEKQYPGIVMQAVTLTFGTLFSLLVVYKSGLIKVTENFKLGIIAATGGICIVYVISLIMSFFGVRSFAYSASPIGIGFSIFVVIIAALNLVLDFDFIEQGSQAGAPKYMEWYGAFGLIVTLIWLYIEILRLLAKLQDRR
ncbi:MAG: Bax inhibitor-1/YccA family protein [Candidatus Omnitrophica bacterium]|nr:Bax inhibitor-1/YccA family protein [Candidatus Omnitrophota bacterium]